MSTQPSISKSQKLRTAASKLFQKIKPPKTNSEEDTDISELTSTNPQLARFITFTHPTSAPQIIDLRAILNRNRNLPARPQSTPLQLHRSIAPCSQADLTRLEQSLQKSFQNPPRSPTSGCEKRVVLDGGLESDGFEVVDERGEDWEWTLLNLPENVYGSLVDGRGSWLI